MKKKIIFIASGAILIFTLFINLTLSTNSACTNLVLENIEALASADESGSITDHICQYEGTMCIGYGKIDSLFGVYPGLSTISPETQNK